MTSVLRLATLENSVNNPNGMCAFELAATSYNHLEAVDGERVRLREIAVHVTRLMGKLKDRVQDHRLAHSAVPA